MRDDAGMSILAAPTTPVGSSLRRWRAARGLSQLELAVTAETTPRHVSFLETGRSRPSRDMVDRLAQALDLPLRERNGLFVAAGLAPIYPENALESEDLAPFRKVVGRLLANHEPYPAYAIDGHWNIVETNRVAQRFLPDQADRNAVRLTYLGPWRELIDNWSDIAWAGVRRLQADAQRFPHDTELAALVDLAANAARDAPRPPFDTPDRVLCPHFRLGDEIVRTISVIAQFGTPLDVTLDELRIELIFPADEAAERVFQRLHAHLDR
jgi:transcriptional regulator with XRE-family HTH domain